MTELKQGKITQKNKLVEGILKRKSGKQNKQTDKWRTYSILIVTNGLCTSKKF
jgi:hypothetical protein